MPLEAAAIPAAYAERMPVYVRASGAAGEASEAYDVVDALTGTTISTGHATPRTALAAALQSHLLESLKPVHFRAIDSGEADGEWRWLDACAEEDEPIYGARLTEQAMWSLASSVTERASAVPIDGGEAAPGFAPSRAHGSGDNAAELANGWVHLGVPVVAANGRTHLYLYAELLPEVAREVDRGRLAYGSVGFGWDDEDADAETGDVYEATLLHHALLNQPAVKSLTPGSERTDHAQRCGVRTRRLTMSQSTTAPKTIGVRLLPLALALILRAAADPELAKALRGTPKTKRGPALEKLRALAATLGMTPEQALEGDDYRPAIVDLICKLVDAGKLETILEGNAAAIATGGQAAALKAVLATALRGWKGPREQVDAALKMMEGDEIDLDALTKVLEGLAAASGEKPKDAVPKVDPPKEPKGAELETPPPPAAAARVVDGLEGATLDAWASDMLATGRGILGKPEATAAEVSTELQASIDFLAAALANKVTPVSGQPSDSPSGAPTGAELAVERSAHAGTRAELTNVRAENVTLKAKVARGEHRDWLREQVAIRKMALPETVEVRVEATAGAAAKTERQPNPDFEQLLDATCQSGRAVTETLLKLTHRPPMEGSVMPDGGRRGPTASQQTQVPSTLTLAVDACLVDAATALRAELGKEPTSNIVVARAQRMASERWPSASWATKSNGAQSADHTAA